MNIIGELFDVNSEVLAALDRLEGHPDEYRCARRARSSTTPHRTQCCRSAGAGGLRSKWSCQTARGPPRRPTSTSARRAVRSSRRESTRASDPSCFHTLKHPLHGDARRCDACGCSVVRAYVFACQCYSGSEPHKWVRLWATLSTQGGFAASVLTAVGGDRVGWANATRTVPVPAARACETAVKLVRPVASADDVADTLRRGNTGAPCHTHGHARHTARECRTWRGLGDDTTRGPEGRFLGLRGTARERTWSVMIWLSTNSAN